MKRAIPLLLVLAMSMPAPTNADDVGERDASLECLIRPRATAQLALPGEGVIAEIHVDRGDVVEKGQVLAELESSVERATVDIARSRVANDAEVERNRVRLEFAKRARERDAKLKETTIISESQLDESQSSLDLAAAGLKAAEQERKLARLELARARALLGLRSIESPMNGVVVDRLKSPGEYAESDAILEISDIDPLHIEVIAPLSLFGRVEVGTEATLWPEEPVGGEHRARVTVVDRLIDAGSGTFGVRLELPNPDYAIPAGLACQVRFDPANDAIGGEGATDRGAAARATRKADTPTDDQRILR